MDTLVRRATFNEREVLRELLAAYLFEFDGQTTPYGYFDAYWSEPERVPFLIEADGDIVGFCLVRLCGRDWTIAEFTVVPEQRRNGVGRQAVASICQSAIEARATYVEATVYRDKTVARAFWMACGFRVIAEGDVIVTRLDLWAGGMD